MMSEIDNHFNINFICINNNKPEFNIPQRNIFVNLQKGWYTIFPSCRVWSVWTWCTAAAAVSTARPMCWPRNTPTLHWEEPGPGRTSKYIDTKMQTCDNEQLKMGCTGSNWIPSNFYGNCDSPINIAHSNCLLCG